MVTMRWHMLAPNGSKSGIARPGRLSPAWQGVGCNSVPPCSNLSQPSSRSALHQWGHAVKTGPCHLPTCSSHSTCSPAEATAPGFSAGTGSGDCACRTSLPAERLSDSCWAAVVVPSGGGKLLETSVGPCLGLSPPAPTQHQKQEEAEGVAPVAQLKPGRNVGCCVMTKAHMLITSIS